jgi:CheY-like chemotaxis protein
VRPIDILLVDDEARNLDALKAILDSPGYRLLRAEDADRALLLLLENDVAAIVLDIKMPQVNGFELAQMIGRRLTRSRPAPTGSRIHPRRSPQPPTEKTG